MPDLKDKVALITGASSGIGAATAEFFASLNCNLVLTGRRLENLYDVKAKCLAASSQIEVLTIPADITDQNQIEKVVQEAEKKFQRLDILINNAGIVVYGQASKASIEDYDQVMNVNVRSTIIVTKLCLPLIVKSKGTIVNVSSVAGICAFPNTAYYCMSKGALDQFTKCLALEMAPKGVRVNSVNPGVILTDIQKKAGMSEEQYAQFLENCKLTHAMGRVGEVAEVAKAIGFLASEDSSFTTGQLLKVDGGRAIMGPN